MGNKKGSGRSKASSPSLDSNEGSPPLPATRAKGKAGGKKAATKASSAPVAASSSSSQVLVTVPISSAGAGLRFSPAALHAFGEFSETPPPFLLLLETPLLRTPLTPPLPPPPSSSTLVLPPSPPSLFFPPLILVPLSPEKELVFVQRIKCSVLNLDVSAQVLVARLLLSNGFSRLFSKSFDPEIIAVACESGLHRPDTTGMETLLSSIDAAVLRPLLSDTEAAQPGLLLSLPSACELDLAMAPPPAASSAALVEDEGISGTLCPPTTLQIPDSAPSGVSVGQLCSNLPADDRGKSTLSFTPSVGPSAPPSLPSLLGPPLSNAGPSDATPNSEPPMAARPPPRAAPPAPRSRVAKTMHAMMKSPTSSPQPWTALFTPTPQSYSLTFSPPNDGRVYFSSSALNETSTQWGNLLVGFFCGKRPPPICH